MTINYLRILSNIMQKIVPLHITIPENKKKRTSIYFTVGYFGFQTYFWVPPIFNYTIIIYFYSDVKNIEWQREQRGRLGGRCHTSSGVDQPSSGHVHC